MILVAVIVPLYATPKSVVLQGSTLVHVLAHVRKEAF